VEMNAGQMVEDVRLAVEGRAPVHFYGRMGGVIPGPDEVVVALRAIVHTEVAQAAEAH
jgi:2-oxoglutarate ferredoxin oxidoreductase subunit alpha